MVVADPCEGGHTGSVNTLTKLLREHMAMPFPVSVENGVSYGRVDPVMIDADVYGWASQIEQGVALSAIDRGRLAAARDDLATSLDLFPVDARPYYDLVLTIADEALR